MLADAQVYIDRYKNNYPLWMKEILGTNVLPTQQKLDDAWAHGNFVSCKSGTGTGKTAYAATKALHFLTTRPESRVPCTAPRPPA